MFTSGLVVTVCDDPAEGAAALRTLAEAGPFELGDGVGSCWPAVLEVPDAEAARRWHAWAEATPGVVAVEVVFVHWEEEAEVSDA